MIHVSTFPTARLNRNHEPLANDIMHISTKTINAISSHSLIENQKRYEPHLTIFQRVRDRNQIFGKGTSERDLRVSKVLKERIMRWRLDVFKTSRVEKSYVLLGFTKDQDAWHSFSSSAVTFVEGSPETSSHKLFEQVK